MEKICGICGEDCADRPRVRDRSGRYFCKACAMDRVARMPPEAGGPSLVAPPPSPGPDADPYEVDPGASPLPIDLVRHVEAVSPCPMCGRSLAPDARICVSCGFDKDKGIQTSTTVGKSTHKGKRGKFCRECGYDLRGLRDPVCPECGTRIRANRRRDWDEETARQVVRAEWMKPAITLAIAGVALAGLFGATGEYELIALYPVFLAAEVALGFVILLISFSFLGDLGTPVLNLLRLTAIYASVDLCSGLFSAIGGLYRLGVTGVVFVVLFMKFFDVDWEDAWIVVLINWVVKMAIVVGVILYFNKA